MKASTVFLIIGIVSFIIVMIMSIDATMHNIRVSSFRIGCMSVDDAPYEAIRACKALAEEKVGHGY